MAKVNKRIRRQALYGWIKWFPVVLIVFSVIFFDCWLHTERRLLDFKLVTLKKEIETAQDDIADFTAQSARLETLDRLEEKAAEYGLQFPDPGKVEHIAYSVETGELIENPHPFSIADASEDTNTTVTLGVKNYIPKDIGAELPEMVELVD